MSKEKFERGDFERFVKRQRLPTPPVDPPGSSSTTTTTTSSTSTTSTTTSTTSSSTTVGVTSPPPTTTTGTPSSSTTSSSSTTTTSTSTLLVPPTTPATTPLSTSTFFVTLTSSSQSIPTINSFQPTTTPTSTSTPTGFFHDKGAVAGTFSAVGVVALILAVLFTTTCIRRRRAKQFDDDVAAAAAAAYRDADGYWEREDTWNNNAAPVSSSGYTSSAYTDGTHGAYNDPAMAVPQGESQNYGDGGTYSAANNYNGGYGGNSAYNSAYNGGYQGANGGYASGGQGASGGYAAGGQGGGGGHATGGQGATGGYATGGEGYGMNNLPNLPRETSYVSPGMIVPATLAAGTAGVGAGAYAAQNRQRSPPPGAQNDGYQGYNDTMGMNDSLDGGRYPVPPVRSRSFNQGPQGSPNQGVGRSLSNSSSGHGHGGYAYAYQPNGGGNGGSPPSVSRAGSKGPVQGYSQSYGAPLPQMQELHNEGDAYDGLSPESDHQQDHDDYGEVEEMPRVLRVANE